MPHVVFDQKLDLSKFVTLFTETILKDSILIKLQNIYVDKAERSALVSSVVIDTQHQQFFIEIVTRENKTTVRLFPLTDPEKTDGVKRSLALLSNLIKKSNPAFVITKTNIGEFLVNENLT